MLLLLEGKKVTLFYKHTFAYHHILLISLDSACGPMPESYSGHDVCLHFLFPDLFPHGNYLLYIPL